MFKAFPYMIRFAILGTTLKVETGRGDIDGIKAESLNVVEFVDDGAPGTSAVPRCRKVPCRYKDRFE
jgi:hypothetical protein